MHRERQRDGQDASASADDAVARDAVPAWNGVARDDVPACAAVRDGVPTWNGHDAVLAASGDVALPHGHLAPAEVRMSQRHYLAVFQRCWEPSSAAVSQEERERDRVAAFQRCWELDQAAVSQKC
jgi:hypothetical protein